MTTCKNCGHGLGIRWTFDRKVKSYYHQAGQDGRHITEEYENHCGCTNPEPKVNS